MNPSRDEWIKVWGVLYVVHIYIWCIHVCVCVYIYTYTVHITWSTAIGIDLEIIMFRKISQRKTNIVCLHSYLYLQNK